MRLYYYYPTFDKPSGGNKQLRLQATLLRELGVETFLLRDEAFFTRAASFDDNHYYGVAVPTAEFPFERAGDSLSPDDVVMLPEVVLERALTACSSWNVRLAVNNQNGFYGLRYGPPARLLRSRIEFAFANAPYVAALCQRFYGLPSQRIFHVPHWVVRPPFEIQAGGERQLAVCYMPRKLPDLVKQVRERVQRDRPDVPWVEIDGVPEAEVATRMRATRVFFAAQDLEGCPLTALEAMACGAIVAGFPGTSRFSHPYATVSNGFWAPDRDVVTAARCVMRAIEIAEVAGRDYAALLEKGYRTANRFTKEVVIAALKEVVGVMQTKAYQSRKAAHWPLSWSELTFAYRSLYDYGRLGLAGHILGWLGTITRPLRALYSAGKG